MTHFDHEKLMVYQKTVEFITWVSKLRETIVKNTAVSNQIDRAATSIALNIAEGNGKYTPADRCRFFDMARGSALECAACLDVLYSNKKIDAEAVHEGKKMLSTIVSMLMGLTRANSEARVYQKKERD